MAHNINITIILHSQKEEFAKKLEELEYFDLADSIVNGLNVFGQPISQRAYDAMIEEAKEIFEENGVSI